MRLQRLATPADGPLETLWASAMWPGGRPITVGVIYRPPDSPVTPSLEHLQEQLRESAGAGRPVFLLSDTNFNVMDTSSSQVRRYSDIISELNMVQLVTSPTHLSPTPSALDHVITNMREPAPEIEVLPDVISDYQPVIMRA